MIGGLVIGLVLETMQGGLFLYQQAQMENITAATARQIMIGTSSSGTLTAQQFHDQVVCPMLPAGMPCANVVIDARVVPQGTNPGGFYAFANTGMNWLVAPPTASTSQFCTGASGNVVYLRLVFTTTALSPAWRAYALTTGVTLNGAAAYQVVSYAAFRNEPFQGGASC